MHLQRKGKTVQLNARVLYGWLIYLHYCQWMGITPEEQVVIRLLGCVHCLVDGVVKHAVQECRGGAFTHAWCSQGLLDPSQLLGQTQDGTVGRLVLKIGILQSVTCISQRRLCGRQGFASPCGATPAICLQAWITTTSTTACKHTPSKHTIKQ